MSKLFIQLGVSRVKISTIKRYTPIGDTTISIRFSTNTNNYNAEAFKFTNKVLRDKALTLLDGNCH